MAALTFFSFFFLGCGPGTAFFLCFISHKSFISLIVLFSAFLFLSLMLITSAIFIGFYPISATVESYAGALAATVFLEELMRYGVWRIHKYSIAYIVRVASETNNTFTLLDRMYLALGWGYGQGLCHSVFFFVSFLQLTASGATYYLDTCPQMSFFFVGALYSLAFGALLPSLMVVYFEGCHTGSWLHMSIPPVVHFAATFLSLGNLRKDGCIIVMPIEVGLGVISIMYASHLCWGKLMKEDYQQAQQMPLNAHQESISAAHDISDGGGSARVRGASCGGNQRGSQNGTSSVAAGHSISSAVQRNTSIRDRDD